MPDKKATHYACAHHVGPFPKGTLVTVEELHKWIGVEKDASDDEKAAAREAGMDRLLKLGAITPAEAPKEPETAVAAPPAEHKPAEHKPAEHKPEPPKK